MLRLIPVVICIFFLFQFCGKEGVRQQDMPMAKVTFLTGSTTVTTAGKNRDLAVGDVLHTGDKIATGPDARLEVFVKGQGIVRIQANTQITLEALDESHKTTLLVQNGSAGFFLKKLDREGDFTVRTPTALAGVRGTAFLVSAVSGSSTISLFGGALMLQNSAGKEVMIDRPGEISVRKDSEFNQNAIRPLSKESLVQLKRLAVFQKSSILEYNSVVDEIRKTELIQKIETSESASDRMNDDSRWGDMPAEKVRRTDQNSISRDTSKDPLKVKPNDSY